MVLPLDARWVGKAVTVDVADLPDTARGPEGMFGVTGLTVDPAGVLGTMKTGRWSNSAGALAVLVDDVLGYAILARRPRQCWSVSTEIGIDLVAPVPIDGQVLHARASLEHADGRGGLAVGVVVTEAGELIARCRQRGRFVPSSPSVPGTRGHQPAPVTEPAGIAGRFAGVAADTSVFDFAVEPALGNPLGNLHGGVTLAASELVASSVAAHADLPELTTSSIHVTYVRPVPVGTVLRLESEVVSRGRSLAVVRVLGRDTQGKPCTVAHVTLH
jgi:uncharacterized protein (TIGR00369 family)